MFILLFCHYKSSSIFHFSPKHDESQKVLDLPAFKIVKPSDTRWLAHVRCVKAVVKTTYKSIVLALENLYESSSEPEALGLSKVPSKHSTIAAMTMFFLRWPNLVVLYRSSTCIS